MVGGGKYGCTFVSISCLQKLIDIDRNIVICGEEDAVFLFSPNPYTAQQNYYGKQDNYVQSATNHLKIKTSNICDEIIIFIALQFLVRFAVAILMVIVTLLLL